MKSSEVSIKTRSTLASLSFKGQATKHTTVKWSIHSITSIALKPVSSISHVMSNHCWGVSVRAMWDPLYYILTTKSKYDKHKIQ